MDSIKNRAIIILTWSFAASFGVFCNMALLVFSLQALENHREYLEGTIPETSWLLFFIPPLVIAVASLILGYWFSSCLPASPALRSCRYHHLELSTTPGFFTSWPPF